MAKIKVCRGDFDLFERNRHYCLSGKKDRAKFHVEINKMTGERMLVKDEKPDNWYEKIQSFKNDVDINTIIKKYVNGDTSVLNKNMPNYGDFSDVPETMIEAHNRIILGKQAFDNLPADIKEKFNNSFDNWLINEGIVPKDTEEKVEDKIEVKKEEVKEGVRDEN